MTDSTMVVHTPEDISPSSDTVSCIRNGHGSDPSMNPDTCSGLLSSASPSSSSITTPSTSANSSPPTDNDGDKDMELIPFIDPEDVIGRRVMFDLPPLAIESEWGLPGPERRSNKSGSGRLLHAQLPSPEDDAQSTMTNFTNLSESESQKGIQRQFSNETGQDDLMSLSATSFGPECITPLLEINSTIQDSVNQLQMTPQSTIENSCIHPAYRNGALTKPNVLEEELIYEDYCFIHWNWPLIRCACKISLISVMIGLLCIAIGLIVTAPRNCGPTREWWQGGIVYEIFPAAFQDSDGNGVGDLAGLTSRLHYIQDLGVGAIRLNSIFASDDYPNMYWSILNLTAVAPVLGTIQDFDAMVASFHAKNIRVILDFNPVYLSKHNSLVSPLLRSTTFDKRNESAELLFPVMMSNDTFMGNLSHGYIQQEIQNAMQFWLSRGVDGFYMKYLEVLDITPQLLFNLLEWRSLMDKHESALGRKILICSGSFFDRLENERKERAEVFMGLFDLVEYQVQFEPDLIDLMPQEVNRYTIRQFSASGVPSPWILWSTGSSETPRLATRLGTDQAIAATLVQLMLPGTVNLLYGDEINLQDDSNNNQNGTFIKHWTPIKWTRQDGFHNSTAHPWLQRFKSDDNTTSSLNILRTVIALRNSSTPLYVASMMHRGEHGNTKVANYKVRFCDDGMLVLERFYPRWSSFVIMANLGEKSRVLDLSSTFYQGKIVVSTKNKIGDVVFKDVHLNSGEAFIARL